MSYGIDNLPEIRICRVSGNDLNADDWHLAEAVMVDRLWSGEPASAKRLFEARLLWNDESIFVNFQYDLFEPLVIDPEPDLSSKSPGLWERDVCELFISPEMDGIRRYFEFEVAPNGEWLDLALESTPGGRLTDWDFSSGMTACSMIDSGRVTMDVRVPWAAFGEVPEEGDVWRGNIFRAVGIGEDRGYLAWSPTFSEVPNFHVPERFGKFIFM